MLGNLAGRAERSLEHAQCSTSGRPAEPVPRALHGLSQGFSRRCKAPPTWGQQQLLAGFGPPGGAGGDALGLSLCLWPFSLFQREAVPPDDPKRVLILMADTGGGHRASAQALKAGFQHTFGKRYKVDIVDIWTHHTPWPFNTLPRTYSWLVRHPFVWRFGYNVQQPRVVHLSSQSMAAVFSTHMVNAMLDEYRPDLVVSVHPLMQQFPLHVLKRRIGQGLQKPIHFATVVTDLTTCHNSWFHRGVSRCFVPTAEAKACGRRMGLKPEQLVQHGLPIRPAFSHKLPGKHKLRQRLGIDRPQPAVLLVGGGEGMGAIEKTVDAVAHRVGAACQMVVICGRNKRLIARLQSKQWPEGMHVSVQGFVDNMEEWMAGCDIIITKAGPGTIAESLIMGLPILLNGFVPCQEAGNVPFVIDNGVGAYEKDPDDLARVLQRWMGDADGELAKLKANAAQLGRQFAGGLFRIVRDLAELADQSGLAAAPAFRKYIPPGAFVDASPALALGG